MLWSIVFGSEWSLALNIIFGFVSRNTTEITTHILKLRLKVSTEISATYFLEGIGRPIFTQASPHTFTCLEKWPGAAQIDSWREKSKLREKISKLHGSMLFKKKLTHMTVTSVF